MLNPPLRYALRVTCAIFLALLGTAYFSKTGSYWLTLTTALLTQASLGFPLQQGLRRFLWLLLLFFVGGQMGLWLPKELPLLVLAIATLSAYAYSSRYQQGLHLALLRLIVLLVTLLLPLSFLNPAYLQDIFMGGALGLGSTLLIFPDQPDREFPKRIAPLLSLLSNYLAALSALLFREEDAEQIAERERAAVEKYWIKPEEAFPLWVFESGFNPALQPGQYYFVVHVGQLTEILFALHYLARYAFPKELLSEFSQVIQTAVAGSQELLRNLSLLLEGKKLSFSETDFTADLPALDECFQSKIKLSLELLDLSRDYVYLAAFIRYLKDLRLQLIQLAGTLT